MSIRLIEPDTVLAGRYVVQDMLVEEGDAESWRAFDRVLARSVVLQVLPSSSPYAHRLIEAAKHASRVPDPRVLQVLDVVNDGVLTYVVREWVGGQALDLLLAEGPLPARRAAWLLQEVAGALTSAHLVGVEHGCLMPSTVVLTDSGGVKILGLATFAALQDCEPAHVDPQYEDVRALGRLLYACLTARWPGVGGTTLPEAPTIRGRFLRPRQVRAGVPRSLDDLCDRILTLSAPPRYAAPLTSAAQVKDALTHLLAADRSTNGSSMARSRAAEAAAARTAPPPAVPSRADGASSDAALTEQGAAARRRRRLGVSATALWAGLALLVAAVMVLAYLTDHHQASVPRSGPASRPTITATTLRQLRIQGAQSFDPYPGSGSENPSLVPFAIDGDPTTAWETLTYRGSPQLGGLKKGVGLVLDLGRVRNVSEVIVSLQGAPTSLELRGAPASATQAPTQAAQQYRLLAELRDVRASAAFRLSHAVATRFLLVWLTSLPPEGPQAYRGRVAEVKVLG